ncbi:MAG: SurA N-terminal domain-containing protein [Candidatus Nomurabacteria bacterium]|nr:SurA N-terminal domain-containing protein [Candidatus Nomurabacteria bacterium]
MGESKNKLTAIREKIAEKLPNKTQQTEKPTRITNDTVAEHREKVLAKGKKFKYPFQYSKHKVLINAIIITIAALAAFSGWLYVMLYKTQATNDFFFSAVKILPLSVANVEGENVPYKDYLRRLRADIFYKETWQDRDFSTEDGQREMNYLKQQEMNNAAMVAYATKIAREQGITVSNEEVEKDIQDSLTDSNGAKLTLAEYEKNTLLKYYNWSLGDYREIRRGELLKAKVMGKVETFEEDFAKLVEQDKIKKYIEIKNPDDSGEES